MARAGECGDEGHPLRFRRSPNLATLAHLVDSGLRFCAGSPPRVLEAMAEEVEAGRGEICGTSAVSRVMGVDFGDGDEAGGK